MRLFRIFMILSALVSSAAMCFGQYGLYGSPDPLSVSQPMTNAAPSSSYAVPAGSSAAAGGQTAAPPGGYTASTSYAQQPVQSYASGQAQPYPAQTTPYTTQPTQSYPSQTVPYTAHQAQPYAAQTTPYSTYSTPQTQAARPAGIYGQTATQYATPGYSGPSYYASAAGQTGTVQAGQAQTAVGAAQATSGGVQLAPAGQVPAMIEPLPAPGIQQNNGVTSQMLAEQGQSSSAGDGQCGVFRPEVNRYEQSACGTCLNGCSEISLWYASISALVMSRDRPNKVYITYETGNLPHNDFPNDELAWRWGGEVRLGRRFCCGCNPGYWAVEASYWTLDNFDGYVSHTSPVSPTNPDGTVGTPLRVQDIEFGGPPGPDGRTWFDNAAEHRLWRRDEVHNVEANIVRGQWCYGQDSPWDLGWSLGVRYFRFQESWRFGTLAGPLVDPVNAPHYWGQNGGIYEAYLTDQITNNLIGPQIGFQLGYNMGYNFRFYMSPSVGIYSNHITNNFNAYLGDGTEANTGSSGVVGTYPVTSSTDKVSFLTQVDVGVDWRFARQWSVQVGYRLVTVSGLGLADAQIPFYIVDIPAIADIDRNGDLILHGAYISLGYNF